MSKSANSVIELNKIEFDSTNNRINFSTAVYSNGSPIADATAGSYANSAFAQANAAFASANNVAPQVQPAFDKANSAGLYANGAFTQANIAFSNTNLNVSGTLKLLTQGGDEGGEIFLGKATTNTTLADGITVDIYQNKLRIFENGGGLRGAFIDIANTTANGVGSEITKYDANTTSTGSLAIPIGTTAQRPAASANGHMRYNTTTGGIEVYLHGAGWTTLILDNYTVEYLIVGGGGGAGTSNGAAGAGAGGLLNGTFTAIARTAYPITVGGGGAASSTSSAKGSNGSVSIISSVATALGGGGSGSENSSTINNGNAGGSGGGGVRQYSGGAGTPGQGNPGGSNINDGPPHYGGGGGGGAGAAGTNGSSSGSGNGGIGGNYAAWATATNTGDSGYYAGGGAGGSYNVTAPGSAGTRGLGGGGPGGSNLSAAQLSGYTNTGGGGGGHGAVNTLGGAGGSGIVILRYVGPQRGQGGSITTAGGYTYHTFTGSGSFTA